MDIRWITGQLGTAAADSLPLECSFALIDARSLIDGEGNSHDKIRELIDLGVVALQSGQKTVVCCDYGMSRSNALASGILSKFKNIPLSRATRLVQEATGEMDIKPGPLKAVRSVLEPLSKPQSKSPGRVLLTGGSGGIGTRLAAMRNWGQQLVARSRSDLDLCAGSTALQMTVQESCVETIIHLAKPRIAATNAALGNALTMLKNVIDVCVSENISLIFPSCSDVYFGYTGYICADEDTARLPKGHLGETKHLSETMIEHYRRNYALKCTILRFARIFGAENMSPKFLLNLIERGKKGLPLETHLFENGDARLDMLHLDDAVAAITTALDKRIYEDFNVGTGRTISTNEIAGFISKHFQSGSEIFRIPICGRTSRIAMNNRKASHLLGWQPQKPLTDWLAQIQ
jgi:nucleoside-diphosphate-sugar epimerase